jgi:hypothetical protein
VSRLTFGIRLVCALVLALASAGPASAQRATGPFEGLFGGDHDSGRVTEPPSQTLDLHGAIFGAYESDSAPTSADTSSLLAPSLQTNTVSEGVNGTVAYSHRSDRVRFQMNGGSGLFNYNQNLNPAQAMYNAGAALAANLGPKTVFGVTGSFAYSPFYQVASFLNGSPDAGLLPPGYQLAAISERNTTSDATISLTSNYSRRSSISASVTGRDWHFLDASSNDVTSWGARADFQHRVTRALGFHLGYGQERPQYAVESEPAVLLQTIDVGLDYGDTLSFARRTALSFSTSTGATRFNGDTHYRLNGNASLTRGFGRTWSAWLGYVRSTDFLAGFRVPLFSDAANLGFGGQLASRLKWSSSGALVRSTVGFSSPSDVFLTYTATSKLDLAMTRSLGLYTQYAYYWYQVPNGSSALPLLPTFGRQSLTAGFSVWVPIINAKGGHDPR